MATRRFCDFCNKELTPENDGPLIREYALELFEPYRESDGDRKKLKVRAHVRVFNEHQHEVPDMCHQCQLHIVTQGEPVHDLPPQRITQLHASVAADTPVPTPPLFAPPIPIKAQPVEPTPAPSVFVPSVAPESQPQ